MDEVLRIEGLTCRPGRGDSRALGPLDLAIRPGEVVLVAGRSGAGKSLLARSLAGLLPRVFPGKVTGRVDLSGTPLASLEPWEVARRLGTVFQDPRAGAFGGTVADEVAFGPENLGLPPAEVARRVDAALEATGLSAFATSPLETLSLGRWQALAVAAALAMQPAVLVLDEPTSMLDAAAARRGLDTLARLADEDGVAVIILEHRTRLVAERATRLVVLECGRVVYDGDPGRVRDRTFCRRFGLRPSEIPAEAGPAPESAGGGANPVARAESVAFAYPGGVPVLADLDLEVPAGAATLVTGPNGSGKTTLLKLLAGLLRPREGRVRYRRGEAWQDGPRRGDVGFVGQAPDYVFRHRTVEAEFASWHGGDGEAEETAKAALARLDLAGLRARHPLSLSEGEKRRLAIASALAARPRLLALDEPSVGFDGAHLDGLLAALHEYARTGGAILLASNDPDVLDRGWPRRMDLARIPAA